MNIAKVIDSFCRRCLLAGVIVLSACGKDGDNRNGALKYALEHPATSTISNALLLEVGGEFKPSFSLSGAGFTAGIPFDTITPFAPRTELTQETFGKTSIVLTLYQENGKAYLTDTLDWQSSGEVPPKPKPYFSELASADAYVYLVLPSTLYRGKNTQEVWVEGDLAPAVAGGSYYTIPADDQVLLELSPGDGVKTLHVKYRNIFGAHSEVVDLTIERKAQGPVNCKATPVSSRTSTGAIRTRMTVTNGGPMYYRVTGDVLVDKDYIEFEDSVEEYIELAGAPGRKNITVKMKDEAGNACPDIKLAIDYDTSYVPGSFTIEGNPIWTDDPAIIILPQFDQLPGDAIEIFVSGGLIADANTDQWIAFQSRLPLTLSPNDGTRHVIVQFRKNATIMAEVTQSVFLRPFVLVSGTAPTQKVIPSHIIGATSLSISGCAETYDHVAYAADFDCTKVSANASVTYYLSDGTSVTRSTPL